MRRQILFAFVLAGSMLAAGCGDVTTAPSVVTRPAAGSVVTILDQQPVSKPQGSTVAILD